MNKRPYFIGAEWDEEASVWVASSEDVPGLATEGETLEGLIEKLKIMIPELPLKNAKKPVMDQIWSSSEDDVWNDL